MSSSGGELIFKRSTTDRGFAQEAVPEHAGNAGIIGVEVSSDPPLGEIRQVLGVMAPPGAMIVPEMVERIVCGSDGENRSVVGCCAHGRDDWVGHTRNPDK